MHDHRADEDLGFGLSEAMHRAVAEVDDTDVADRVLARRRRRRRRVRLAAASPLVAAGALALVIVVGPEIRDPTAGATLRVAHHRFQAPPTYRRTSRRCPALKRSGVIERFTSPVISAAKHRGACLSIVGVLSPPQSGRLVRVGDREARLSRSPGGLTLIVMAPDQSRGIVFASTGMTERDLLATARSGIKTLR